MLLARRSRPAVQFLTRSGLGVGDPWSTGTSQAEIDPYEPPISIRSGKVSLLQEPMGLSFGARAITGFTTQELYNFGHCT